MLIRAPQDWPHPLVAFVAMVLLAVLDLGGAFAAKEAVARRSPLLAAVGITLFVGLFWVYCSSLQYADLAPVTLGWVVLLQVGVLLLDRYRYAAQLPVGKWVAVVVILAAQAYLLLGASSPPVLPAAPADAPSVATVDLSSADGAGTSPGTSSGASSGTSSGAASGGRHVATW
jgi:hypothetical protein